MSLPSLKELAKLRNDTIVRAQMLAGPSGDPKRDAQVAATEQAERRALLEQRITLLIDTRKTVLARFDADIAREKTALASMAGKSKKRGGSS